MEGGTGMNAVAARRAGRDSRTRRTLTAIVAICVLAVWATGLPVTAAEESDEQAAIGTVWGGPEYYEYSSLLIEWDREDGVYRSGDEEGSFAFLLSLPGAEGWEFVTILAESWFETSLDDRAAWDVFRWRVVLRRPWEPPGSTEE